MTAEQPHRTLCARYFDMVVAAGAEGITGDEIAALVGSEVYLVRPRLTDLKDRGRIVSKGIRREGAHGVGTTVWIHPRHAQRPAQADLFGSGN